MNLWGGSRIAVLPGGGMGQVTVTLNGRTYRLRCGDGEEPRLLALAEHVKGKVDQLVGEFGQVGDDRLMLMAALLVTDELFELLDPSQSKPAAAPDSGNARPATPQSHNRPAGTV